MIEVTPYQLQLMHHTLGVNPERLTPYRNFFVASPGHHDIDHLEVLVATGHMARGYRPAFLEDDDVVFQCTDAGRAYALDNLPHPPKRSRFQEFLAYDGGYANFADFLGIRVPEVEWNREWGKAARYRYVRRERLYRDDVAGEWRPTKKEAKASYKEALRKRRGAERVKP